MLPNEFSAYIKQKSQLPAINTAPSDGTNFYGISNSPSFLNGNSNSPFLNMMNNNESNNGGMNNNHHHHHNHQTSSNTFLPSYLNSHQPTLNATNNLLINDSYSFDRFTQDLQSLNSQTLLNLIPVLNNNSNSNNNHNNNNGKLNDNSSFYFNSLNNHSSDQSELTFNLLKDIIDDNSSFDDFSFNSSLNGSSQLTGGADLVNDNDINGFNSNTNNSNANSLLADKFDHLSLLN